MKDVHFGFGKSLGSGRIPSVALNGHGNVVMVHEASNGVKRHRLGRLNQATINWGKCQHSDSGVAPRVALNDRNLAVEVHRNRGDRALYCRAGWVDVRHDELEWRRANSYAGANRARPAVALNNADLVVEMHEVHEGRKVWLEHAVGEVRQFPLLHVKWGDRVRGVEGGAPAIAINNRARVVALHRHAYGATDRTVYYTVGDVDGKTVRFQPYKPVTLPDGVIVHGHDPTVALTDDGMVVVVLQERTAKRVLELTGQLNGNSITWNRWWIYDEGVCASVAAAGTMAVEVHQHAAQVHFSTSLVTDRASWMQNRLGALGRKRLGDLVLPASHDAGMYKTNIPDLSRNQNLSIYEQLRYGIRYFDLRPMWLLGQGPWLIHHGGTPGPTMQTVLEDVKKFATEEAGEDGKDHQELVILKLSHFQYADNNHYKRLAKQVTDTIGPWLVTSKPPDKRLADMTLNEYVKNGPAILVVVDKDFAIVNPAKGLWVYRNWNTNDPGHLCVHDSYADTSNLDKMRTDQSDKFARFRGHMEHDPKLPCDLFLLSWTLTPKSSIPPWRLSREANPIVGDEIRLGPPPPRISIPNQHGRIINLVYVDYVESARVTDVALFLNGERATTTAEAKPRRRTKSTTRRQAKTKPRRRAKATTRRRTR